MSDTEITALSEQAATAWAQLLRTSQALLSAVESDLKAQDFPPLAWYDALLELRGAKDGLRPFELQKQMLLAQYNMSRLLDRLTAAGYVARLPCDQDGRGQVIKITKSGKAVLTGMWPAYRVSIVKHFAGLLEDTELDALSVILGKLARQQS